MPNKKAKFINKELSWLSFNARVMQEAADPTVPLIERIKFLGIFSNNSDEFFRVRAATLNRISKIGKKAKKVVGDDPKKVLKEIQRIVIQQNQEFDRVYQQALKNLADEKIFIVNEKQLDEVQSNFVRSYFQQEVRPKLFPIMIDQVDKFPDLKDRSIYLAVCLSKENDPKKTRHALIEVPTDALSRFLILPRSSSGTSIILLDDVIRHGLVDIFSILNFDRIEAFTIKLTRDAELEIDEDLSQSLIKKVYKSLKQRKEGSPVRLIYDSQIPRAFLDLLTRRLGLTDSDTIIPGGRYHNFKDFMNFPIRGMSQMKYTPIAFLGHKDLDSQKSLLEAVKRKDILLHFPYQSFDYVIDLLREASIDPKVTSIKITLYRVARNSSVVNALINAVRNGKAVTVVLELQARFDEEANINWANRLQEEGARVIYGVPGLKVHSKLCLITIKEKGKPFHYALIGTGNFNEDTARIYGDHSLLTVDKRLTKEVANIFEFFESNYKLNPFKHLIVSPFQMRKKLSRLIQHEIKNAEIGREAYIILKLNNLVDPPLIKKLYEASEAGVKIRLIVRSMFSLVPGVPQLSSNIEAISIVDKFLEHSRVFVFCNGGNARYFISSADIMQRNIDHRLEVTCPIYDKSIQDELKNYLEIQWRDNVKARILNDGLTNSIKVEDSGKKIRSQLEIYDYLRKLTSKDTQKI